MEIEKEKRNREKEEGAYPSSKCVVPSVDGDQSPSCSTDALLFMRSGYTFLLVGVFIVVMYGGLLVFGSGSSCSNVAL